MDEQHNHEEPSQEGSWIQENLRIIVSVFIVAAIALGIYSYSQRVEVSMEDDDLADLLDTNGEEDSEDEATDEDGAMTEEDGDETVSGETDTDIPTGEVSQETDTAFIETANPGDGTTHLARRALANHLEKNPDSSLTPEHKVYIEDYLRKHSGQKGHLAPGDSVEFSKDLIREAIDSSKNLNADQLEHLKRYSQNVSDFR